MACDLKMNVLADRLTYISLSQIRYQLSHLSGSVAGYHWAVIG